jgi:hypothetical protein
MAFASSEVRGSRAHLKLRRWAASRGTEPLDCEVEAYERIYRVEVAPQNVGGGWLEYFATFPRTSRALA